MSTGKVFCPCREHSTLDGNIPETLLSNETSFGLEWLYFCEICKTVKCPQCITHDVVVRFCPTCLVEVPSSIARSTNNTCPRNCMSCPDCFSLLSVKSDKNCYFLECPYCSWSSDKDRLQFAKSKTLSLTAQLREKKYQQEKDRFEYLQKCYSEQMYENLDEPVILSESDIRYPHLVNLRAKKTTRCSGCRHILCKSESSVNSTEFPIQSSAIGFLPKLRLAKVDGQAILTIWNALPYAVNLSISVASVPGCRNTTLLCPDIELEPCIENVDGMSLIQSVPSFMVTRETAASKKVFMEGLRKTENSRGIFQSGRGWKSIFIEFGPSAETFNVPLFISMSYTAEIERDNESQKEAVQVGFWSILDSDI